MTNEQNCTNIESLFNPTHDELARQRFVSTLRKHAIVDLRTEMKAQYEQSVKPRLDAQGQPPSSWRDIDAAMQRHPVYRLYSSVRYNAQEMCFHSVQPTVERNLGAMISAARTSERQCSAGGSLSLDPAFEVPTYVTRLDVHLVPGYTHKEYTEGDVAQGAVVAFGGRVFTNQQPHRKSHGAVAESVSYWISRTFPDLQPLKVLDMGTCSGKNLLPYGETFPSATLYGIDVGAPVLRYGHAFAEQEGVAVHFSQQNAERTHFADGTFDIITSSFFLHEVPVKSTKRILAECRRLLAPGGVMVHMELPNEAAASDYENFFWNWDTRNNNEPFYTDFRGQDLQALCSEAGFDSDDCFAQLIPDLPSFGAKRADECIAGRQPTPQHGSGGWFVFGARLKP